MSKVLIRKLWKKHAEMESLLGQLEGKLKKTSKLAKLKKLKSGKQRLI